MTSQFNDVLSGAIYTAVADDAADPAADPGNPGFIGEQLLNYLDGLKVGKRFPGSILIVVNAVDEDSVTFLVRGRMKINKGRFAPFVRAEVRVLKTQLGVDEVPALFADLKIVENETVPTTEVVMGLGYDGLIFSGRGGARVVPVGFGLDIFLGGVSDRGIMIGIDVFLPVPVPLGPTGLGLNGLGGDYAHNFKPRLESGLEAEGPILDLETGEKPPGEPVEIIENPTAINYVQWARNPDDALDRWVEAPDHETAIGIAVRAFLGDVLSNGDVIQIEPIGFAVFTPGAIIILGGEGKLLNSDSITLEAFAVIDGNSGSFALGGGVDIKVPKSGAMLDGKGRFDSFFSRSDPTSWFIALGTERDPNKVKFLAGFEAVFYLDINHFRLAFGLTVNWKEEFGIAKVFKIFVMAGVGVRALIGWNPKQLAGAITFKGEAGIKIWKFKLSVSLKAVFYGHIPQPKVLEATAKVAINLPFPISKIELTVKAPRQREDNSPSLKVPFVGEVEMRAAVHPKSGRQWDLANPSDNPVDHPWPDSSLVINFSRRLTDETGKVLGPAVAPENNGGYDVAHRLTALQIFDITGDEPVEVDGVQAVWAEGPDGEAMQLHVLAQDPYSWLSWNGSVSSSLNVPEPVTSLQHFGLGSNLTFEDERRFGKLLVNPAPHGDLNDTFAFALQNRVITASDLTVRLRTTADQAIAADVIWFYLIEHRTSVSSASKVFAFDVNGDPLVALPGQFIPIFPDLYLVTYSVGILPGTALSEFRITSKQTQAPFHLYAVSYREVPVAEQTCSQKVLLEPGRYRLEAAGTTSATSVDGLAEPDPLDWSLEREFDVVHPYSLRPYLRDTTIGDSRLFGDQEEIWNPTLFGIGFPAYRHYLPAVRFNVPYMSDMFPHIRFELRYDESGLPAYSFTGVPVAAADGENSLLDPAEDFQEWVGCPIEPDEELAADDPLDHAGEAEIRLSFDAPDGTVTQLENWSCYVSRFASFTDHVALSQTTLKQVYDADGPRTMPSCFTPGDIGFTSRRPIGRGRINPPVVFAADLVAAPSAGRLLPEDLPISGGPQPPEELTEPPLPWRLPSKLAQHLGDNGVAVPVAFARFAFDTGAAFFEDPANTLFGVNNTVEDTTAEAVVDGQGRPYAIWLRTPEPLDWRRVEASLRIWHLKGSGVCATERDFRKVLDLTIEILPGPDASSAFLVGSLNGIRTRLPRGEYELTLSFDPSQAGLPRLRPGPTVGSGAEVTKLKFLQVSGENWPTPGTPVILPAALLQHIVALARGSGSVDELLSTTTLAADAGDLNGLMAEMPDMVKLLPPMAASPPRPRRRRDRVKVVAPKRAPRKSYKS